MNVTVNIPNVQLKDVNKSLLKGANLIVNRIKAETPHDTGNLRRSTFAVPIKDGEVLVYNNTDYGIYVNSGTGIYAVNGDGRQTPWVYTPDGGEHFYTTKGQEPNDFWERGTSKDNINDMIAVITKSLIEEGLI